VIIHSCVGNGIPNRKFASDSRVNSRSQSAPIRAPSSRPQSRTKELLACALSKNAELRRPISVEASISDAVAFLPLCRRWLPLAGIRDWQHCASRVLRDGHRSRRLRRSPSRPGIASCSAASRSRVCAVACRLDCARPHQRIRSETLGKRPVQSALHRPTSPHA
jgi:hypothetical protein